MPRWSVDIIRKRAEHLGEVDAPDEQAAIKRAAEVFDIPPERQKPDQRAQDRQGPHPRPAPPAEYRA
jgi:hypothetical protein